MIVGLMLGRLAGIATLTRFNNMERVVRSTVLAHRWLGRERDHMIAVSRAVSCWATKAYRVPEGGVPVVDNGVDVVRFGAPAEVVRQRVRSALGIEADTPVIGLIGRVDLTQKGQDVAIRAMPEILARHPQALLLVVGDGPDRAQCEEQARRAKLETCVRFTGRREDVPDVLAATDIVMVPSTCEDAFPSIAMEAQAAGRPVVVSRSGGLPEVVLNEETGLVVPKCDPAALARAVVRLLDDPDLARRLAINGRARAKTFSLERHVEALTCLYEQLVAETP